MVHFVVVSFPKVADQEALPFKMVYALSHEQGGLRAFICPEALHSCWNDTKNAIRRSNLQHVLLLATCMNNVVHGPFRSGRNQQTLQESVADFAKRVDFNQFEELVELIAHDRFLEADDDSLPQCPEELLKMACFTKTPAFDSQLV